MKRFLVLTLVMSVSYGHAVTNGALGLEHSREIKRRADGNFDVQCIDGKMEMKTPDELSRGQVCMHIATVSGAYYLKEGGMKDGLRLCDLDITRLVAGDTIMNMEVTLRSPCTGASEKTDECSGMSCIFQIEADRYSADFSGTTMNLKRLSDGLTAVYTGTGSPGEPAPEGQIRLAAMGNEQNILQASQDGMNWFSVCDDSFGQEDAEVACRQLGYGGVARFSTAVEVEDDTEYGLDDLQCTGTESSLFACPANDWRVENCQPSEHVQSFCQ